MGKTKRKAIKNALILNKQKIKILASLTTLSIISGSNMINMGINSERQKETNLLFEEAHKKAIENNDTFFKAAQNGSNIVIANYETSIPKDYTIIDDNIIDSNDNIVSLKNEEKDTYFFQYRMSAQFLDRINLKESKITTLSINNCGVGNYIVDYLPSTLTALSLRKCSFITNLDELPSVCPNIESLDLNLMPSLSNLDFIYELPNLKYINLAESPYITTELVNYLENNNIQNNIGIVDIGASIHIDNIINKIITPDMSDKEKIKQVTSYVINHISYNFDKTEESNKSPLTSTLLNQEGVCTSYAYLTTVLLNKAGINAFKIINDDHAWTLVKLDGKYYYLDSTNIDTSNFYQNLLNYLNISNNYMIDTNNTFNTSLTSPSNEKTIIPLELVYDIANGRNDKSLIEKYGVDLFNKARYIASILAGILTYLGIIPIIGTVLLTYDLNKNLKLDYEDEITKSFIKNLEQ